MVPPAAHNIRLLIDMLFQLMTRSQLSVPLSETLGIGLSCKFASADNQASSVLH